MNALLIFNLKQHLLTSLEEDGGSLDWTSKAATKGGKKAKATIVSKDEGVWCGSYLCPAVESLASELKLNLSVKPLKEDGSSLKKGEHVVSWSGDAEAILIFERSFLNIASYLSGIATRTAGFKKLAGKNGPRITSTRKILPGYRDLAIYAVLSGGGHSHRVNLSGGILIKENHIRAAGGIGKAIRRVREIAPHGLKIEVEVTDLKELEEVLSERAEVVLLDNFTVSDVESALKLKKKCSYPVLFEVSGGISEETIQSYIKPGVDIISVGGLTHSVKAFDLSLLFSKKG